MGGTQTNVMAAYQSSLTPSSQRDHDFAPVLSATVDPLIQVIHSNPPSTCTDDMERTQ
jgi:hypothetical protein